MDRKILYENLAKHLHQGIIGAPMSPTLIGILEIMFTEEEAVIACKLPFENKSLEELKTMFPDKSTSLETILTAMAKNGTVFTNRNQGRKESIVFSPRLWVLPKPLTGQVWILIRPVSSHRSGFNTGMKASVKSWPEISQL
jgi:hypothetical protein